MRDKMCGTTVAYGSATRSGTGVGGATGGGTTHNLVDRIRLGADCPAEALLKEGVLLPAVEVRCGLVGDDLVERQHVERHHERLFDLERQADGMVVIHALGLGNDKRMVRDRARSAIDIHETVGTLS